MDPLLTSVENLPPDVMKRLCKEIAELTKAPMEGIRLEVNDRDIRDIVCSIDGPADTPFYGGVFKVRLILPKDFPHSPPKGYFLTKIFHPNVAIPSGEICVNTLKRDWKPTLGIKNILLTIKCLLIDPNPESALNEEAGRLLLENYASYAKRAAMITEIHARPRQPTSSTSASGSESILKRQSSSMAAENTAAVKLKKESTKRLKRL